MVSGLFLLWRDSVKATNRTTRILSWFEHYRAHPQSKVMQFIIRLKSLREWTNVNPMFSIAKK